MVKTPFEIQIKRIQLGEEKRLKCPIIVLDGTVDITDNLNKIISIIDNLG